MNKTAIITISNLTFIDAKPQVALDDITFVDCTADTDPNCTDVSYVESNLTFTVSHFTTYKAVAADVCTTLNANNTVYTLENDVNTTGDCFSIKYGNVTSMFAEAAFKCVFICSRITDIFFKETSGRKRCSISTKRLMWVPLYLWASQHTCLCWQPYAENCYADPAPLWDIEDF